MIKKQDFIFPIEEYENDQIVRKRTLILKNLKPTNNKTIIYGKMVSLVEENREGLISKDTAVKRFKKILQHYTTSKKQPYDRTLITDLVKYLK